MKLGLALLRSIIGVLFMGHGLQKLAGWFGGHGLDGTGQFFESLGLRPGRRHATAAGAAETAGGALLAAGLLTPLGATLITRHDGHRDPQGPRQERSLGERRRL